MDFAVPLQSTKIIISSFDFKAFLPSLITLWVDMIPYKILAIGDFSENLPILNPPIINNYMDKPIKP